MVEADGDGERGGLGGEGAAGAGVGLSGVVDVGDAAVGVGVDIAADLLGEVEDEVGEAGGVAGDLEAGDGVLNVHAQIALAVEDLEAALGAVDGDGGHDAAVELAGRYRPVGVGVLGELVVPLAAGGEAEGGNGDQEAAESLGAKILGKDTSILQREQLQNLSAAACFCGHFYTAEYNKRCGGSRLRGVGGKGVGLRFGVGRGGGLGWFD